MAEHTGVFNWLKSKVSTGFIQFRSFAAYYTSDGSTVPQSQLPNDNSFVTRGMLNIVAESMSAGPQVITDIVGGTTPNPITVDYASIQNPTLIFRNADGSNYGGATNNTDTGTSIILQGDDDGSGHFVDSFTFTIKP